MYTSIGNPITRPTLWLQALLIFVSLIGILAFFHVPEGLEDSPVLVGDPKNPTVTYPARPQPTVPSSLTQGVEQHPSYLQEDLAEKCSGYDLTALKKDKSGIVATLSLAGSACNAYGMDYEKLELRVVYQSKHQIRIYIRDSLGRNFDLASRADIYDSPLYQASDASFVEDYDFAYNSVPFEFWVSRKSDDEILFDTRGHILVFEDQYLQLTTNTPLNPNIYGLGETIHELRLGNNYTRTLFAGDIPDWIDANLYGSHPFYMEQRYKTSHGKASHSSHGVLLMTSNNMDVLIRPGTLQYRVTGGVIDLYIFTGPSPLAVTQQYVQSIGLPAMQSYWTLGFHQCRWGYTSTADTRDVVENYKKANIPLETIWNDIDYMQQYRDWTLDPNYLDIGDYVETLHENEQHYVPIVDAAIYASNPENRSEDSYHPYYKGLEQDTFIKNPDGTNYIGAVWPGYTVFPDWLADNTSAWWLESLHNFSTQYTQYDGIWLDMNEVASFCVGSCGTGRLTDNQVHPPFSLPGEAVASKSIHSVDPILSERSLDAASSGAKYNVNYPPYAINNHHGSADLAVHAVSPNATHADGTTEYDIHNLFGYGEQIATYEALQKIRPGERPFLLSRSTFPGSGRFAAHWGGDNYSKWNYMFYSIPQALIFQIFGIPMVGPDTCGFSGNADEELCSRWMQLSAFFPFYRNHNTLNADAQEAYVWPSVAEASRSAMQIRYALLPYWYTLFDLAHKYGSPTIRALFMEFPDDPTLAAADRQFLVGDALMVIPVLEPNVKHTKGVFPGIGKDEVWYDWYTNERVDEPAGSNVTIPAPLGFIPLYVRGGRIIPLQEPGYTTAASRRNDWNLLVALGLNGTASGALYQDDGISENPLQTTTVEFSVIDSKLHAIQSGSYSISQPLSSITVMGIQQKPKAVSFEQHEISTWEYKDDIGALYISGLQKYTGEGAFKGSSSGNDLSSTASTAGSTKTGWQVTWK